MTYSWNFRSFSTYLEFFSGDYISALISFGTYYPGKGCSIIIENLNDGYFNEGDALFVIVKIQIRRIRKGRTKFVSTELKRRLDVTDWEIKKLIQTNKSGDV